MQLRFSSCEKEYRRISMEGGLILMLGASHGLVAQRWKTVTDVRIHSMAGGDRTEIMLDCGGTGRGQREYPDDDPRHQPV